MGRASSITFLDSSNRFSLVSTAAFVLSVRKFFSPIILKYIARFIQRLGYGAIRGSSTRGGVGALVEMIRTMRQGVPMAFTVDGPKGPRYTAKSGAVLLAKKTGNPIMPFVVELRRFWTVRSWDRLQIPVPFTRARLMIAEPIFVEPDSTDENVRNKLAELQTSLDARVSDGAAWRASS